MPTRQDIENMFTYHAPTDDEKLKLSAINEAAKALAMVIAESVPVCADQSAALRKVREARMTANAAIVCNRS